MGGIQAGSPVIYQPHVDIYSGIALYSGQGEGGLVEILPTDKRRNGGIERIADDKVANVTLELLTREASIDDFLKGMQSVILGHNGEELKRRLRNVIENYQPISPEELMILFGRFGIK